MNRRKFLHAAALAASTQAAIPSAQNVSNVQAPVGNPFLTAQRGLFSKTFQHDALTGESAPQVWTQLGEALAARNIAGLEALPIQNEIRLVSPLSGAAFQNWKFAQQVKLPALPPPIESSALAEQALELYWMALLRDEKLWSLERASLAQEAARELANTKTFANITAEKLFRGIASEIPAAQHGYAISMLLWLPIPYGAHQVWQAYKMPFSGQDFLTDWPTWLDIQNGNWPRGILQHDSVLHYLRSGRDLAEYVRWDFSYQAFINAGQILLGDPHLPRKVLHPSNPYKTARTQNGFATLGGAELLALIGRAADMALKAAWHVKWDHSGFLRPEEYGGLIEKDRIPAAQFLKNSAAGKRVKAKFGSYLLPQAYPEGAPAHPAFPSGHAAIAGACATVLKAFVDPDYNFRFPLQPTRDGRDWEQYVGPPTNARTEIDKLAANVAIGRQWAGIHWLSDSIGGLQLGEQVGLAVLAEAKANYAETKAGWFKGFHVFKFDGTQVTI